MEEWRDRGLVLTARRHGEGDALVTLLTENHGRHAGLVRGGAGRRAAGTWEPGTLVDAAWRARLAEHLGRLSGEVIRAHAAPLLGDGDRLAALAAVCALLETTLPEREAHPVLFAGTLALLETLPAGDWAAGYVRWEAGLLAEVGFGLDLAACAAGGPADDLAWVSPRTGRAVSRGAGAPWADRLLPLPGFLHDPAAAADWPAVAAGLALTGHFIERHPIAGRGPLAARARLVDRVARLATMAGS